VSLGPGTGKTYLATGLAIRACQSGHRVLFATASQWVARLADAHHAGRLQTELVAARYERASLIVTSNKPCGSWGEVFGDDVGAAAMIDRLVHHAEVIALKGDSSDLRTETSVVSQPLRPANNDPKVVKIELPETGQYSAAVDMADCILDQVHTLVGMMDADRRRPLNRCGESV
jgi:hypothetical protein